MNNKMLGLVCAGIMLMCSGIVNAADKVKGELPPPPPGHEFEHLGKSPKFDKGMHQKMADKFAKDLDLTDEQKAQAKKIRQEGRKKVEPLMKEMKELRAKMDKMREENMKEFEKILTPEQKAKLEKMKKEHDEMREKRRMERKNKREEGKRKKHLKD